MIDSHQLHDEVNASIFKNEADKILKELFKSYSDVILTGGSGLFIDALCFGLDELPVDENVHQKIESDYKEHGLDYIVQELCEFDPEAKHLVALKNPRRVIRALEICKITGQKLSELWQGIKSQNDFEVEIFVIDHPREILYDRINKRVDHMIDSGLLDEARSVYPKKELRSLNTVGYKELFDYFDGITNLDHAIELIKQNTRRYAKRQLTWFRRYEQAHWIKHSNNDQMIEEIMNVLQNKSL